MANRDALQRRLHRDKGVGLLRTDNASLMFDRQRIA